jgi:Polyketide cyclase / dehydrase and lipid transport
MVDRTTSSITVTVPRPAVMAVIADFEAYPQWATGVHSAEIVRRDGDGRADAVRDGDASVHWHLNQSQPGAMITELAGGYVLDDQGGSTSVTYDLTIGVRIPVIGMIKRRAEKTIIDTALKGLKSRAEDAVRNGGGQA